jgi:hypothetical protein
MLRRDNLFGALVYYGKSGTTVNRRDSLLIL